MRRAGRAGGKACLLANLLMLPRASGHRRRQYMSACRPLGQTVGTPVAAAPLPCRRAAHVCVGAGAVAGRHTAASMRAAAGSRRRCKRHRWRRAERQQQQQQLQQQQLERQRHPGEGFRLLAPHGWILSTHRCSAGQIMVPAAAMRHCLPAPTTAAALCSFVGALCYLVAATCPA